jgi:hypothetical protein
VEGSSGETHGWLAELVTRQKLKLVITGVSNAVGMNGIFVSIANLQ